MLLLPLLTLIAYRFPVGIHLNYDVMVGFDGYLPVFRGRQSLAEIAMTVDVAGAGPSPEGVPRVISEIKAFHLRLNGATLPFGPESVKTFFPRTTVDCTPEGKQVKTDAPNLRLPVHLPGLDVKRFPDITYLPIEFPINGIEQGKPFNFQKLFGESPVSYEVTPTKINADSVSLSIKLSQTYVAFEDEKKAPTDEGKAATKIVTDLDGAGTATFDLKRGLVTELNIEANSVGHATDLKTQNQVERKLKTTLKVTLSNP